MKIRPEDFEALKTACLSVVSRHPEARGRYKARGLSDMRYRWDIFHAATDHSVSENTDRFHASNLYTYLNDSHIDTALRAILGVSQ